MSRKNETGRHRASLNHRQTLYALAYIECLDGTLSAELAGYSKKSAKSASKVLQRHPLVRAAIDRGLEEREHELKDKAVKAMEHTYAQAISDIGDCFDEEGNPLPLHRMPREVRRALSAVEVEFSEHIEGNRVVRTPKLARFKLHDKRASQELFAKYAGRLKERVELESVALEQLVMQADRLFREAQAKVVKAG